MDLMTKLRSLRYKRPEEIRQLRESLTDLGREIEIIRTTYQTRKIQGNRNNLNLIDPKTESARLYTAIYDEFWKVLSHDGKLFIQKNPSVIQLYVDSIFATSPHQDRYTVKDFIRLNPLEELLSRIERHAAYQKEHGTL